MNRYKFDDSLNEKGKKKHIHLLDGKPLIGTTTALKVLSKPLTWWASGLAVAELGWIKPLKPYDKPKPTKAQIEKNEGERLASAEASMRRISLMAAENSPEQYLALLDKAYRAHADILDKSAETGTDMHEELEKYIKGCIEQYDGTPQGNGGRLLENAAEPVYIFAGWAIKNVKRFLVSEGHAYSEKLWVGCILDLLYEDKEGRLVILDFKSSKEAYLSQFFQCAGNDLQISESGVLDKDGNLLYKPERSVEYYGIFPFGMEKPEPSFHFDTEGAKEGFKAALTLHKLNTK